MAGFVVAVTGGVASGKSAVCRLFQELEVPVVDADLAARELVEQGQPVLAEITARFGDDVLNSDGSLDRAQLRKRIFTDPGARQDLEKIMHPRIRQMLQAQCAEASGPYVVVAIPLLAEAGAAAAYTWLDRIVVVDATIATQRARLVRRDGIDESLADQMISAQASRNQRLQLATDVIVNDGPLHQLSGAVRRLDALFLRMSAARAG